MIPFENHSLAFFGKIIVIVMVNHLYASLMSFNSVKVKKLLSNFLKHARQFLKDSLRYNK